MSGLSGGVDWSKARGDLALSFGGQLVTKLVNYALLAVLARHLTQEAFGEFLYGAATASMLVLFTDPGTRRYLVREAATTPAEAVGRFGQVLSLRLPLYVPFFFLIAAFGVFLRQGLVTVLMLSAMYVGLRSLWGSVEALLLGLRRVGTAVVTSAVGRLVLLAIVLAIVARGYGLIDVLWGHVAAYGLLMAAGLLFIARRLGRLRIGLSGGLRVVARAALPFFLIDALEIVHFKVDTVMLGFFRPYAQVALYEGSAKLLEATQFMMRPLMAVFLPVCAALVVEGKWPELHRLVRRLVLGAAGVGTLVAATVFAVATFAVTLVYGDGFEAAAPMLRILSLATPFLYLSFVSLFVGNALHLERRAVGVLVASVGINIALNLVLIPPLGGLGAAMTTVSTHIVLAVLLIRINRVSLRNRRVGPAGAIEDTEG